MPAARARLHAAALLGYVSVAVAFAWPLPLEIDRALLGGPGGDTAVYVWNLWVFRHELVSLGAFPFFTSQILHATPPVPLTLHNYTPAANLAALPLHPLVGTVGTFNVLTLASGVLAAYAAFLLARQQVGDPAAAWVGGALFGFSPFTTARQMAHFSLVQTAALPLFVLVLFRIGVHGPTWRRALALGAVFALAYASDPYYAVYCGLIGVFFAGWHVIRVERRPHRTPDALRLTLDVAIGLAVALVLVLLVTGGGSLALGDRQLSVRGLHTPVLLLTLLAVGRACVGRWPRISWDGPMLIRFAGVGVRACLTAVVLLSPIVVAIVSHVGEGHWIAPPVHWRSSPPGVDLLAFFVPNPVGTLTEGPATAWLASMPDGSLHENVASIPWAALAAMAAAVWCARSRLPLFWVAFTAGAGLLALGPFITAAGINTFVPTPWALLRYLPVVGAARMPTRFTVLVMLGVAVLLAYAVASIRRRTGGSASAVAIGAVLLVELCPAPRQLYEVRIPAFTQLMAADPRGVSVMHLPFGLRDGLSSAGDFSAYAQLLQTYHEKPLVGGYLSRLPDGEVHRHRQIPLIDVLLDLSEGREVAPERVARALRQAYGDRPKLNIGYVIVDTVRASPALVDFAREALDMQYVKTDGPYSLYIVR